MIKMIGVLFAVAMVCTFAASASADVCSTFDEDLDGWTVHPECFWSSNGNPDGFLYCNDSGPSGSAPIAPAKFLGNLSSLDGVGHISFDHKIFSPGSCVAGYVPYRIYIAGPGGSAEWLGETPDGATDWVTVDAQLTETEWSLLSGSWTTLLDNVTEMRIPVELVNNCHHPGGDTAGIDNVCLKTGGGGPCSGTAEASTYRAISIDGTSDFGKHLAYLVLPLGAVIAIRFWRRKR